MSFKRVVSILILVILLASCGGCEVETGRTHAWMSFEAGMKLARNMGRPVVIDFYTSWCRWCLLVAPGAVGAAAPGDGRGEATRRPVAASGRLVIAG